MKTLVLMAHEPSCAMLLEALRQQGHEVEVASDAEAALAAYQSADYPLLLVDVDHFAAESMELCRRLRTLPHSESRLVIALTKSTDPTHLNALLDVGFDDFLPDPSSDPQLLPSRLKVALRRARALGTCWFSMHRAHQLVSPRCALARDVPYGVFRLGRDGKFSRVNDALIHLLGYESERELLAADFPHNVCRDPAAWERLTTQAIHQPGGVELDCQRKDGTPIVIRVFGHQLHDSEQGQFAGIEGIIHDVTGEKQMEGALRDNEQRYLQLLEAITNYTYTVTVERGAVVSSDHSPQCVSVTGYTPEEYASDPQLWLSIVPPEDRPLVQRQVAQACEGAAVEPVEHRITTKDGAIRWVRRTLICKCDAQQELDHYDGLVEDITKRKRAEQELELDAQMQKALSSILQLSLEDASLEEILQRTLDVLFSIPFLRLQSKGAIFLTEKDPEVLVLKVQRGLPPGLLDVCHQVPVGSCLCGRAAATRELVFADCVNDRHDRQYPGMVPHGHYCVPIVSDERVFGVVNLYVSEGHVTQQVEQRFLISIADVLAGTIKRRTAEQSLRVTQAELIAAERIQQHLLPHSPPNLPGFDIHGALIPAEFAAGDFFDYLTLADGSPGILLGDVSGHGFSAALLAASAQARIQSLAETHPEIDQILARANVALAREVDESRLVTTILARLEPQSRTLLYASAGHPEGYVINPRGSVKARLKSGSIPLAITAEAQFPLSAPVTLEAGDLVVFLTDGILEARSAENVLFGTDRTLEVLTANRHKSAREIIDCLFSAVCEFTERPHPQDDMTAVVLKVQPT